MEVRNSESKQSERVLPVVELKHVSQRDAKSNDRLVDGRINNPASVCRTKLEECAKAVSEIYNLYGCSEKTVKSSLEKTVNWWMILAEHCEWNWMKLMKWKLASFYAYHIRNELPPAPQDKVQDKPSVLLKGAAGRWATKILRVQLPRNGEEAWDAEEQKKMSFITSLLYAKKGCPRASSADLRKAEQEAVKALTQEQKVRSNTRTTLFERMNWADIGTTRQGLLDRLESIDRSYMEDAIKRVVLELFKDVSYTMEDRLNLFSPSLNANYNMSRSKGGQLGEILNGESSERLVQDLKEEKTRVTAEEDKEYPLEIMQRIMEGKWVEEIKIKAEQGKERKAYEVKEDSSRKYETFYYRLVAEALNEKPLVAPVALPEALKYRVISMGPPMTYMAL
jgi:hypothetical protein